MTTTTGAAPMSAEEVLAVMDADISRYQVSAEIDALTCSDESAKVLRKRVMTMIQARTAVSAMAEREAALVKEVEALRAWCTLETPMLDILLMQGDDPVVIAAHGKIAGVIESVVDDLKQNPLPEFEQHGDGVYTVRAHYFSGQYGEYGRCEFPPGWELELISVDTAIDAARAEARDG